MFYALVMAFCLIFWLIISVCVLRDEVHELWTWIRVHGDPYEEWRKFLNEVEENDHEMS